jgi:hypothetical protein
MSLKNRMSFTVFFESNSLMLMLSKSPCYHMMRVPALQTLRRTPRPELPGAWKAGYRGDSTGPGRPGVSVNTRSYCCGSTMANRRPKGKLVPNVSGEYQQSCCLKDSWKCVGR